jgi:hypothetical protein
VTPNPKVIAAPRSGFWRVGRSPDPLHFSDPLNPSLLENPSAGNRFDSPTGDYRICYFATTLDGCFGETLARFRPRSNAVAESSPPPLESSKPHTYRYAGEPACKRAPVEGELA